jgi:hypothetical protein
MNQWTYGYGGGTTANILATCVPALTGNPDARSKPQACVVLAGTNDAGAAISKASTIANLNAIYTALISFGVVPIAATIPPSNTASRQDPIEQLNVAIVANAKSRGIAIADFYSALVDPSNGQYLAGMYIDATHPSPQGHAVMGYVLSLVLNSMCGAEVAIKTTALYDNSAITTQNRNPNLNITLGAATINVAGSYPGQWSAPATVAMSTVFNSSGTEPGTGKAIYTMFPAIAGLQPNYQGNAWGLAGDGTANTVSTSLSTIVPCTVGDVLALSFRIKWIPSGSAPAQVGSFFVGLLDTGNGQKVAGLACNKEFGGANLTTQIGSEASYLAGDFYCEYTVPSGLSGASNALNLYVQLSNHNSTGTNTGDFLVIANPRLINLTTAGAI